MKLLIIMTIFLVSCGKKKPEIQVLNPSLGNEMNSVIVNELNWLGADDVSSVEVNAANPVGLLKVKSSSSLCSAFMISRNVAMTNYHCIKNSRQARGAVVEFGYHNKDSQTLKVKCDKFIKGDRSLDYSLLECENDPGDEVGIVTFSKRKKPKRGEKIMIAHHNCDYYNDIYCAPYMKFSFGRILKNKKRLRNSLFHDADTLSGSSGSPIFYYNRDSESYYLVGIHNQGHGDRNDNGRGVYNSGILMSEIQKDIEERRL